MDICVDFDGTCVTHEFPTVGQEIGADSVLKELVDAGHRLILFTMRSNNLPNEMFLDNAVQWFDRHEIPLFGINRNPDQDAWTSSPKAYGSLYIDDAALGAPLKINPAKSEKPFIDWKLVRKMLVEDGHLNAST